MKIYVGTDHRGYQLKQPLVKFLKDSGYPVLDDGDQRLDPDDDFPVFAKQVVTDVLASDDKDARGILLCGSGQGMCMAANRHKGIRAVLGYNREAAKLSRNDDDSNILCLPADDLENNQLKQIVDVWLNTKFEAAPRFVRRLKELDEL
ncbi:MAG TPA: RpiB/LacA/LacB family sugar-phosphate isomerase [Candidatus Saccharimonadales bacterium]|nr:RpiB/LacA/LacB family sugar-phosphate isomerase [Candidatus Saccharimonadales bacterium]